MRAAATPPLYLRQKPVYRRLLPVPAGGWTEGRRVFG